MDETDSRCCDLMKQVGVYSVDKTKVKDDFPQFPKMGKSVQFNACRNALREAIDCPCPGEARIQ